MTNKYMTETIFNFIIVTHMIHIQCIDMIGIILDGENTRGGELTGFNLRGGGCVDFVNGAGTWGGGVDNHCVEG